jgi:hypothetical protein
MPGTIIELHGSRTFNLSTTGGSATFLYYIHGEEDEATAEQLVRSVAPLAWYSFTMSAIDMKNRPTKDQWFPVVTYSLPVFQQTAPLPVGDPAVDPAPSGGGGMGGSPGASDPVAGVAVSITTENKRVTRSLETISSHGLGGAPVTNFKRLIGVSSDGKVEGVDVPVVTATLRVRRTLGRLTVGYLKNVLHCVGKTNAEKWWIFGFEEGLFNGMSGNQKPTGEFECDYEFQYSKTEKNIVIRSVDDEGGLVVPEKKGWNYLWVSYKRSTDPTTGDIVEKPVAAYVERVIDTADFAWLGI